MDRLSPYWGNEVNGEVLPPPEPVTVEGEEEYEIDHIRDSKMFGRPLKYLVRWTGYGEGEDTWEPAKNLAYAPEKIEEFHSKNPGAPRKIAVLLYVSCLGNRFNLNLLWPTWTLLPKEGGNVTDTFISQYFSTLKSTLLVT